MDISGMTSFDHRHNRVPSFRVVGNKACTDGVENLDNKAESEIQKISDSNLTNRASHELVCLLHSGARDVVSPATCRLTVAFS
jgi:hypothetical protein